MDDAPEFFLPPSWRCRPDSSIKQGSGTDTIDLEDSDLWLEEPDTVYGHGDILKLTLKWYNNAIAQGVAPEQARMILPQNTMTQWIWTGSLMAFARVCEQRLDPHAQQETQEIAQLIYKEMESAFPVSWEAVMQ